VTERMATITQGAPKKKNRGAAVQRRRAARNHKKRIHDHEKKKNQGFTRAGEGGAELLTERRKRERLKGMGRGPGHKWKTDRDPPPTREDGVCWDRGDTKFRGPVKK